MQVVFVETGRSCGLWIARGNNTSPPCGSYTPANVKVTWFFRRVSGFPSSLKKHQPVPRTGPKVHWWRLHQAWSRLLSCNECSLCRYHHSQRTDSPLLLFWFTSWTDIDPFRLMSGIASITLQRHAWLKVIESQQRRLEYAECTLLWIMPLADAQCLPTTWCFLASMNGSRAWMTHPIIMTIFYVQCSPVIEGQRGKVQP